MEREKMRKRIVITLSTLLGLAVLGFLGYRFIAPFGKIVYYRFLSKLPGAEETVTYSTEKGSILKIPSQIIRTPQSKFSIKLLSPNIESAKVTLKFKEGPKEIKLGVKGNEKDNFFYQPLYHSLIQDLNWEKIEEEVTLFQKTKNYSNLSSFTTSPPENAAVASYFYDPVNLLIFQPREKPKENLIINAKLRGDHTFYVQVVQMPFNLAVEKVDQNAYEGEDEYKIRIFDNQNVIAEKTISDDGITDNSRLVTEPQREEISIPEAKLGVYKVEMSFMGEHSDSMISKIETNQGKFVAVKTLFLVGEDPTSFWTNAKILSVGTSHEESEQVIKLDDEYELDIEKFDVRYDFDLNHPEDKENIKNIHKLESLKNDLGFSGENAIFAFSQDSFFYPEIIKSVDLNTITDLKDIDYVLTTCPQAKREGDWLVAEISFDSNQIKVEGDKLYFSLEIPELSKYGGELEIDYLEIVVKSKGAFEKEEEGKPSPSPLPTPTIEAAETINILVKVLNGGAGKGEAGRFAEKLKESGFTNTSAGNADRYDYKDATISYRGEDKKATEKIVELLKEDYKTIIQKEIATTSAEIVVIIGEK